MLKSPKNKMIRKAPKTKWDSKGYIMAERERIILLIEKKRIPGAVLEDEITRNQTIEEILYDLKGQAV